MAWLPFAFISLSRALPPPRFLPLCVPLSLLLAWAIGSGVLYELFARRLISSTVVSVFSVTPSILITIGTKHLLFLCVYARCHVCTLHLARAPFCFCALDSFFCVRRARVGG